MGITTIYIIVAIMNFDIIFMKYLTFLLIKKIKKNKLVQGSFSTTKVIFSLKIYSTPLFQVILESKKYWWENFTIEKYTLLSLSYRMEVASY